MPPSFPPAQQAQIIRSNQRDLFHVLSLREQTENVLRSWLGTRWLTRWDKEIELCTKLIYYGLTIGRESQTLGEEYTNIWLQSAYTGRMPSLTSRAALILLPTLPSYLLARCNRGNSHTSVISRVLRRLPVTLEVLSELNLMAFYFRGTYYNLAKRLLGIRYISPVSEDPNSRPPSYSLLGILLGVRLLYRFIRYIRSLSTQPEHGFSTQGKRPMNDTHETYVDDLPISSMLGPIDADNLPTVPAEEDERTVLEIRRILPSVRAGRNCTLCLEERTSSCATECGHLFCWSCIVGWGREKPECPLCRQSLNLTRLLPIYNL